MINSEDAWPFEDPVTEEIAPGYFEMIEVRPERKMEVELLEALLVWWGGWLRN